MALTLPYPGMDFVPLDILTAAEQDQLVANIEYIANQFPIASANIANSAVTSAQIDFSTLANNTAFIQTGEKTNVNFQGTSNPSGGFQTVNFSPSFPVGVTPIVVASGSVSNGYVGAVMITSVSNSQFQFLARNGYSTDATGGTVRWIAINPNALSIKSA